MHELFAWIGSHIGAATALLFTINIAFVSFVIILENREPERAHGWLLVLFTFPFIGFILYVFFGHNWHRKSKHERWRSHVDVQERKEKALENNSCYATAGDIERRLRLFSVSMTGLPATAGNHVRILTDAHVKYPRLIAAIKNAKRTIDLEYYIYRHDEIGRQIIELLKKKVREGVRVRFLVDGYGSFGLGWKAFQDMRAAGIRARYFAPLITLFYFFKANYRDHRKIVVIDGETAFTGGINIGDEYLGKSPRGPWRDTSIELRGPCVHQVATLFEEAWNRSTRADVCECAPSPQPLADGDIINVIPSGPDTDWFAVQNLYVDMINSATTSILIQTPYFIPDAGLEEALVNAALRGIDVQIMLPRYPDNQLLRWVARTYLNNILRAGGRVFEYRVGFLHQKVIVIDETIATTGTCNIDIRSFRLDFEINVLLSAPEPVHHLLEDIERDMQLCDEVTYNAYLSRPFLTRVRDSLVRLIAPLL